MAIQSINPFNNQLLKSFEPHTNQHIDAALNRAQESFRIWSQETFEFRSSLFKRLSVLLKREKPDLAQLITMEMGKVVTEALAEIDKCALACDYYAEHAESFLKDQDLKSTQGKAFISYEPLGAVLAVMPWNFPFWQVFRFAVPTLMAGNVGLLKHASNVPQCALAIEKMFNEVGFPEGVFQTLLIGASKVESIINDDRVQAVTLTGSGPAGSKVAEAAGRNIKMSLLELGGSDPFIVLEDAAVKKTARMAAKARMINCGQSCIAAKRFIVHEKVCDEFLGHFLTEMETYAVGDPAGKQTKCGPMASESLLLELEEQVRKSVMLGARVILGGERVEGSGAFFQPTVLTEVKKGMPAYDEELFGPVASVIKVRNHEEAIAIANDSRFGLGGSVWTEDLDTGLKFAREVSTGAMFVNQMVMSQPELPFGGIKKSGYGRELSHLGIRTFTNQKTVYVAQR